MEREQLNYNFYDWIKTAKFEFTDGDCTLEWPLQVFFFLFWWKIYVFFDIRLCRVRQIWELQLISLKITDKQWIMKTKSTNWMFLWMFQFVFFFVSAGGECVTRSSLVFCSSRSLDAIEAARWLFPVWWFTNGMFNSKNEDWRIQLLGEMNLQLVEKSQKTF